MKKFIKLIFINLLVFVGILIVLEFLLAIAFDSSHFYQGKPSTGISEKLDTSTHNKKVFLPNYDSIEWAYRYYLEADRTSKAAYQSFIGFKLKPFQGKTISIGIDGFRKTTLTPSLGDSPSQAVFLGGSTMFGAGSADDYTIPSYFAIKQHKYEVLNFGQPAYSAYQSFILLQLEVTKSLSPDLVVTYDGVNNAPVLHGPFAHLREQQFKEKLQGVDQEDKPTDFYSFRALRHLVKIVKSKITTVPPESQKEALSVEKDQEGAVELLESWLAMKRLCDQIGADFICILQPHAFVGNPDLSNLLNSNYKRWHRGMQDAYGYYDEVIKLMKTDHYQELAPHFLDLTRAFDQMPNTYVDFCHVSPNGNEKIADEIVKNLIISNLGIH